MTPSLFLYTKLLLLGFGAIFWNVILFSLLGTVGLAALLYVMVHRSPRQ